MYINIEGLNIHYQKKGEGPPVILLHGHGESIYTWRYNVDSLSDCFTVYVIDLKGFGDSDKPLDEDYSISSMAELIIRFTIKLDINKAVLICHSFAGKIGIYAILKYPERFAGLALLDCVVGTYKMWPSLRLLSINHIGEFLLKLFKRRRDAGLLRVLHDESYILCEKDIEEFYRYNQSRESRNAFLKYLREFQKDNGVLYDRLHEISVPTLIIWGKNDKFVGVDHGIRLNDQMLNSELKIVEDCGHNPHEDQPEKVNELIKEYLLN